MPNEHTIAENLQRLVDAKDDIAAAITAKGGTVTQGDGLEEFPADIASIQGGLEMNVKFTQYDKTIPAYMFYNNHGSGSTNSTYPIAEAVISGGARSISPYSFYKCYSLKKVTIGNGVTNIFSSAFQNCTNLTSVTIGNGVKRIEDLAFYECTSLESINIPDSVTSIGGSTFGVCTNLRTITINKPQGSISGAPWGATNATVVWTG